LPGHTFELAVVKGPNLLLDIQSSLSLFQW